MAEHEATPGADGADTGEGETSPGRFSPKRVLEALRSASGAARGFVHNTVVAALHGRQPLGGWRDLWPAPLLLIAGIAALLGVRQYIAGAPEADFAAALSTVEQFVADDEYERAIAYLNDPLGKYILTDQASALERARFYALSADTIFLSQQAGGLDLASNHEQIVEFYTAARTAAGYDLSPNQRDRLVDSLLALDRIEDALAEADRFSAEQTARRHAVLRRIAERTLNHPTESFPRSRALNLINAIALDERVSEDDRLWAVEWRARLQLRDGHNDRAIDRLLSELQSLTNRETEAAARLFVLLGRGYLRAGRPEAAAPHLERAIARLPVTDRAAGEAEALLAETRNAMGHTEEAWDLYASVAERFPRDQAGVRANLGLAELASAAGRYGDARRFFGNVLTSLERGEGGFLVSHEQVLSSLRRVYDRLALAGGRDDALHFALLMEASYGEHAPADTLLRTATIHRAIADGLIEAVPRASDGLPDFSVVDPVVLEEARSHYYRSARRFQQVAQDQMLADAEAAADALWNAADGFDRAGDLKAARAAFGEYVQLRTADDPRQVAALYRLARAAQAAGDYREAVELFERLLADHPTSAEGYQSYVPLAQCYLLLGGEEGEELAEARLRAVVEGQIVDPAALEYREAMVELGMLYMRTQRYAADVRYPRAIEMLSTAIERYPELRGEPRVLVALADANRLSAKAIADELHQSMRSSERERRRTTRVSRLQDAMRLYEDAQSALRQAAAEGRPSDSELLRNVMLYRGDSAYALGKHFDGQPDLERRYLTEAIKLYDTASRRYPEDPASLVAMVQIVNCHARLGNWQHARTAQRKAHARLDELSDAQLMSSSMPMSREHWEEWLGSTLHLDRLAAAEAGRR
jgi:tetratricopeptide (TPR) repeat protein